MKMSSNYLLQLIFTHTNQCDESTLENLPVI